MATKNKGGWLSIFRRTNQGLQSEVENVAAVDASQSGRQRFRVGQRAGRPRRKITPTLFDNCEMVRIFAFEGGCQVCGFRARYAIRQAPNGKGRELVCLEVLGSGLVGSMAEGCQTHAVLDTIAADRGLDFRTIATLAGETYLVVRKPPSVAPVRNGDEPCAECVDLSVHVHPS